MLPVHNPKLLFLLQKLDSNGVLKTSQLVKTINSVQNQNRQYKSFILFLAFSCQMKRVEDNRNYTESCSWDAEADCQKKCCMLDMSVYIN